VFTPPWRRHPRGDSPLEPDLFLRAIQDFRVTVTVVVPTMLMRCASTRTSGPL